MRTHELKCWPEPYAALRSGDKTFEFRRDDRGYAVGDRLEIRRWCPHKKYWMEPFSERLDFEVSYVLHGGQFGVPAGFVVMGLKAVEP